MKVSTCILFQFSREKRSRPWLENPKTDFNLQCREISRESQLHPSEAALATLPHYLHPSLPMEKSEVQTQYRNPFQVLLIFKEYKTVHYFYFQSREFYNTEVTSISKPVVAHLQQTCLV